jgi:hypothetical protein
MDFIDFDVDLGPRDHVNENIYKSFQTGEANGNPRYGMTVRASVWPEQLRQRSAIKHWTQRPGLNPQPLPVIGEADYILVAGGKKPRVDWTDRHTRALLAERIEEARLRNESDDWAFRDLHLNLKGVGFEIGQVPSYREGRFPLPLGFKSDTLVYTIHKVTLI